MFSKGKPGKIYKLYSYLHNVNAKRVVWNKAGFWKKIFFYTPVECNNVNLVKVSAWYLQTSLRFAKVYSGTHAVCYLRNDVAYIPLTDFHASPRRQINLIKQKIWKCIILHDI